MLRGKDRLIVALDVPTHDEAVALVDTLDNVSFFKIGLELFMSGNLVGLLERLQERRREDGGIFVDLKLSGDIGNTITNLVKQCSRLNVMFLTLAETVPLAATLATVQTARKARDDSGQPQLLMVPFLSSLDERDLPKNAGESLEQYILRRADVMLEAGCDGLILSGDAIAYCRQKFGDGISIVSPGIRPAWAGADDHKRHTTPAQAIQLGADYLVVGRPIRSAQSQRDAAKRVIDEIDNELDRNAPVRSGLSMSSASATPLMAKPH